MKNLFHTAAFCLVMLLASCETDVFPTLDTTQPQFVVDAWINNKAEAQRILLTTTLPYYENQFNPGVVGATVYVTDDQGKRYDFVAGSEDGEYIWLPTAQDTVFGAVGRQYDLTIELDSITVSAESRMGRVPPIDSVIFKFEEEDNFFPEGYYGEFFARDPLGPGDTYWIQTYKNGEYLNKPEEINIAFDAGFSEGGNIDGLVFIPPIREAVNPFDEDENDEFLPPYDIGDSIRVEIHSISNEAHRFLNEMAIQINRPGGFAELFAVPLANLPSNIETTGNTEVLGFFNVAAVSTGSNVLEE